VSIQDQGSGIGKNDIKRLFDYNGLMKSKRVGENGLGLSICRQVICALGGDIICQSRRDGLGSNFTFAIKLNQVPKQDEEILSQQDIPFANI
jgi:signal transduction histidine kinase